MQNKESATWKTGNLKLSSQRSKKKKEWKKSEESLTDLWDTIKRNNIHIMGISKGEEKKKKKENIFKPIMAENFLNLGSEMDIQIHES